MEQVLLAGGLILVITVLLYCAAAAISIFADGMAVVLRDAGARDRVGASRANRRWRIGILMCRRLGC